MTKILIIIILIWITAFAWLIWIVSPKKITRKNRKILKFKSKSNQKENPVFKAIYNPREFRRPKN